MADLPPNWRSAKDSDGKEYYFNELTGETSWKFPEVEGDKPAAVSDVTPSVSAVADSSEFAPSEEPPMAMPTYGGGSRSVGAGGASALSATLGAGTLPRLMLIMFCSVVVLLQSAIYAGRVSGGGAESYGIAVGCISLGFSGIFVFIAKRRPDTFSNWTLPKVKGDLSLSQVFAIFLVAWWMPAAAVLTFFAPFTVTSNAFFATWAAVVCSLLNLGSAFSRVQVALQSMSAIQDDANVKSLAGLSLSSAVVLFSTIEFVGSSGDAVFGLVGGVISTLLAVLLYYLVDKKKVGPPVKKGCALLLVGLWLAMACVLTFDAPFAITGNGYFGTWFATFCALSFAYQEFVGGEMPLGSSLRQSFAFSPMEENTTAEPAPIAPSANVA